MHLRQLWRMFTLQNWNIRVHAAFVCCHVCCYLGHLCIMIEIPFRHNAIESLHDSPTDLRLAFLQWKRVICTSLQSEANSRFSGKPRRSSRLTHVSMGSLPEFGTPERTSSPNPQDDSTEISELLRRQEKLRQKNRRSQQRHRDKQKVWCDMNVTFTATQRPIVAIRITSMLRHTHFSNFLEFRDG